MNLNNVPDPALQEGEATDDAKAAKPTQSNERTSERRNERTNERAQFRTENRSVLPVKRLTKRFSFEFYVDQLTRLKRLKNQAEERGESLSSSEIVRKALDDYFEKLAD